MLFQIPQKQFEEAGRDPVQFEKLFLRAQKELRWTRNFVFVFVAVLLVPAIWIPIALFHSFQLLRDGHIDLASKSLDSFSWLTKSQPMLVTCIFLLYLTVTLLVVAAREADARVKMLLLFRSLRDARTSSADARPS